MIREHLSLVPLVLLVDVLRVTRSFRATATLSQILEEGFPPPALAPLVPLVHKSNRTAIDAIPMKDMPLYAVSRGC